jgi:hypothetical protein
MNFLSKLLAGIAFVPAAVQQIESIFGKHPGSDKKQAALALVGTAISAADAVANKDILSADQFQQGLGKVIDGVVACLNASAWAKK